MKTQKPAKLLQTELFIAYLLRFGVLTCGAVALTGIVLTWCRPAALARFSTQTLPGLASGALLPGVEIPKTPSEVFAGVWAMHPDTVIALGLLLLIALPVLRVGLTVVLFTLEKDRLYFCITLYVFCVLLSGILLGKAL